ncbi:hypothetical protein EAG_04025 [Camponotus floridanus]|uniref:Uncharacterized protein n=1 Tax=Camponotus floridanus TaxID=104421 RepID=E2A796_CAMFO|nr:hypothetical protein EAG_04025 [Camponotus floridanus]
MRGSEQYDLNKSNGIEFCRSQIGSGRQNLKKRSNDARKGRCGRRSEVREGAVFWRCPSAPSFGAWRSFPDVLSRRMAIAAAVIPGCRGEAMLPSPVRTHDAGLSGTGSSALRNVLGLSFFTVVGRRCRSPQVFGVRR